MFVPTQARAFDQLLSSYKEEPVVRIGVLLKAKEAALSTADGYEVIDAESGEALATGGKGVFRVILEPSPAMGVPGSEYRVSVGSFKSFEDASFAVDFLAGLKMNVKIAYPDQWYLWFGPFKSTSEARAAHSKLRAAGYENSKVEPVPVGRAGFTVLDAKRNMIFTGSGKVFIKSLNGKIDIGDKTYRGNAEILPDSIGFFSVVNVVKTEDYLKGVVPNEMPPSAHFEALKAQAIIARTYLLNNRHRHREDGFELCSTTDCQVYGGIKNEADSSNRAIEATRGIVVAYGEKLANALFFSTSGGITAGYCDIWSSDRTPPYLVSVNDGVAMRGGIKSEEDFNAFLADMLAIVRESIPRFTNSRGLTINRLNDIRITQRSESGRALKVIVSTDSGDFLFERDTIRWVLGKLKSTMFTVQKTVDQNGAESYFFRGAGWGHGVGLCQMSAMKLAREGAGYKDILGKYYPGTRLVSLW